MAKIRLVDVKREQGISKMKGIHNLIQRGKINKYIIDGYVCYDEDELEEHKRTVKDGRPAKIN